MYICSPLSVLTTVTPFISSLELSFSRVVCQRSRPSALSLSSLYRFQPGLYFQRDTFSQYNITLHVSMGLLPQLMPNDVLVLHCPLCTFHSHLLNSIEKHFDDVHCNQITDYIIYRCAICHKVASCRHFMHEHVTLIHSKHMSIPEKLSQDNSSSSLSKSTSSNDLYNSSIAFISVYFSGKLYSKSQQLNGFASDRCCQVQPSPDTRPCSRAISDINDRPQYKCIFCKSLHNSFQHLQSHYVHHGIRNLDNQTNEIISDETNGSLHSEKTLNIEENEDDDDKSKLSASCKQELKEMYRVTNNSIDNESFSQEKRSAQTSSSNNSMSIEFMSQSPLKSFNQISTSLQNRSSLFNLIMQQSANQSPQSLSNEEKISPQNIDNFCSVGLSLPFPISNKVSPLNQRLSGNNWFGGLSPSQLITSPILSSLHTQFGLPSLHQHMMNAYAAVNGGPPSLSVSNSGFNCSSPNTLMSGSNIMTTNADISNSGNTPGSPSFSNNDLFQIPKGFPSVYSSVINANGVNHMNSLVDNSIDLSSNNNKRSFDKIQSSSESDRSSLSLSPTDKYQHLNNRTQQDEHSEQSSGNGANTIDSNNGEESQIYSMKRVVGLSRTNLPFQARKILFGWLTSHLREPYPSEEEKIRLANETGLSRTTVNNWFINARRRYVKPLLQGKLGMTSGVLKSMLENNNGIIHNQRNQFTTNVISSGIKRKTMINNISENEDTSNTKRRSSNNNNTINNNNNNNNNIPIKSSHSRCVDSYIPENNIRVKFEYDIVKLDEKQKLDLPISEIVESSKENRVVIENRHGVLNNDTAKDEIIIPSSFKDLPQELTKTAQDATVDI